MVLKIDYLPIEEIKVYEKNPRRNNRAVEVVKKSIEKYGFRVPIILGSNKVLIAGHTRLKAAKELGMKEVPVVQADDLTESEQKGLRIMDNKSSEYAEWDTELLKEEFMELEAEDYDLELTGFDLREVGDILDTEKEDIGKVDKLGHLEVECPKCHYKFHRKDA